MHKIARTFAVLPILVLLTTNIIQAQGRKPTEQQLKKWLQQYPEADADGDGVLTIEEAQAYRRAGGQAISADESREGIPVAREIDTHPGWDTGTFPDTAVYRKRPSEIMAIYKSGPVARSAPAPADAMSFPQPKDGGMRIVGVGHSFMAPAYKTLPAICEAAGFQQPMCLHTGGGVTGSARYKWEQENGIFAFEGKPVPKLLAAISNSGWEAMLWGGYYDDRPEFYTCWIEFCTKYHPDMKFYLSDTWPQLYQLGEQYGMKEIPKSENFFTDDILKSLRDHKQQSFITLVEIIREKTTKNVFIIPTNAAVSEAARLFVAGRLPGVEGLHKLTSGRERSIWRDKTGHLSPGFARLEGYVFYATIYGKSPELITAPIQFSDEPDYPGDELDKIFRKAAWEAVTGHPFSGVTDRNNNGIGDHLEKDLHLQ